MPWLDWVTPYWERAMAGGRAGHRTVAALESLRLERGDHWAYLLEVISHADPARLLAGGCPPGEYVYEVDDIYERLPDVTSAGDLQRLMNEVFAESFGEAEAPLSPYELPAREFWNYWLASDGKWRPDPEIFESRMTRVPYEYVHTYYTALCLEQIVLPLPARYQCPCCGWYTFLHFPFSGRANCPVCQWTFDVVGQELPDRSTGANHVSLEAARATYLEVGVSDPRRSRRARPPTPEEQRQLSAEAIEALPHPDPERLAWERMPTALAQVLAVFSPAVPQRKLKNLARYEPEGKRLCELLVQARADSPSAIAQIIADAGLLAPESDPPAQGEQTRESRARSAAVMVWKNLWKHWSDFQRFME